jgi:UDPglucose 6-dehydrogenase
MREAPSISIINNILKLGGSVTAYDPVAMENARDTFGDKIKYATNEETACKDADALLILTEWNEFRNPKFENLSQIMNERVIFDGRNLFNPREVEKNGFSYVSIGRTSFIKSKICNNKKAS